MSEARDTPTPPLDSAGGPPRTTLRQLLLAWWRSRGADGERFPREPLRANSLAVLLVGSVAALIGWYATTVHFLYLSMLFVASPVAVGYAAAVIAGWSRPLSLGTGALVGAGAVVFPSALFFLMGWEGLICLVMALPLLLSLGAFGGLCGAWITRFARRRSRVGTMAGLVLVLPAGFGLESALAPPPEIFTVRTTIEVAAPPEVVWRHVVTFSELPPPEQWIFRTGIAYPIRAEIDGIGVAALRRCVFTTGAFVEPIEVWDEPRRLAFSVLDSPPPMRELNPFHEVDAPHLHGFMVSKRGEFLLEALPGGRTRLTGTTWYQHGLRPASYWRLWSDAILHRIHLRVLRHVKVLAEGEASNSGGG